MTLLTLAVAGALPFAATLAPAPAVPAAGPAAVELSAVRRAAAAAPAPPRVAAPAAAARAPECRVKMARSEDTFDVATYFSWYSKPDQFDCMSARPIEGVFRSADRGRIRAHFERLAANGFDGVAGVIYGDPRDSGGIPRQMRWMRRAAKVARKVGLEFLPLYDFSIASHFSARLCNPFAGDCPPGHEVVTEYNFDRHPVLQEMVLEHLEMIADLFILPFSDPDRPERSTARYLRNAAGEVVRDEAGLPRPEIYLYIPRVWTDDSGLATVRGVLESASAAYRRRGLGRPAFTLDVLELRRGQFDAALVAAFGDLAQRLTSFFPTTPQAADLGELARRHRAMYRRAARKAERLINRGRLPGELQIAASTAPNFDKRKWASCHGGFGDIAWPAEDPEDWAEAFVMLTDSSRQPVCEAAAGQRVEARIQNLRFVYAGEGFEATWLCAEEASGDGRYPNRYGCDPLVGYGELRRQLGER